MTGTRLVLAAALVVLCFANPLTAQTPTAPAGDAGAAAAPTRYASLVERVKQGDTAVDLADLREAFTETPAYGARMMGVYQQLWTPLGRGDFPSALQVAERVLEMNYVEINAHMVASIAQQQLGNAQRAVFHRDVANGLLRAVMSKGDGTTTETAWTVIDISEEYAVMRALNLSMQSQGLSMSGGHSYDVLRVTDTRTKEQRALYFNVDRSMAAMSKGRTAPAPQAPPAN